MTESLHKIPIQHLPSFSAKDIPVDILRLDLVHPIVSGNKWFKLRYLIADALAAGKTTLATFGGAWSNHIVATAFAAEQAGLRSVGFIRGEAAAEPSATLLQAMAFGMEIRYTDRARFRHPEQIIQENENPHWHWVMQGGYGERGARGAEDILHTADTSSYTDILCATGTGTMLAGLARAALPGQKITGISVLRNHASIGDEIRALLGKSTRPFSVLHDYHFGGYAKHPRPLLDFMNTVWATEQLPTDIVYTSRLLFAAKDLVDRGYFTPGARILLIHSGGLQGNRSLPPGTLSFS